MRHARRPPRARASIRCVLRGIRSERHDRERSWCTVHGAATTRCTARSIQRGRGQMTLANPLTILMPVYEDWDSVRLLLPLIDDALAAANLRARIVVVDDGSQRTRPADLVTHELQCVNEVAAIVLRRNLGHQRALCVGICAIGEREEWSR